MEFTWDPKKAKKVAAEHKVEFSKIEDIFRDPYAIEFVDESHSESDDLRFAIIGLTAEYGLIYLVFSESDNDTIRFIKARRADRWMVNEYEEKRRRI
jgi:uncharacterized DUF497 family protein